MYQERQLYFLCLLLFLNNVIQLIAWPLLKDPDCANISHFSLEFPWWHTHSWRHIFKWLLKFFFHQNIWMEAVCWGMTMTKREIPPPLSTFNKACISSCWASMWIVLFSYCCVSSSEHMCGFNIGLKVACPYLIRWMASSTGGPNYLTYLIISFKLGLLRSLNDIPFAYICIF